LAPEEPALGNVENIPTQATIAAERLRQDILSSVLAPGTRLGVDNLCTRYGVSASPLREALSQLVAEDLVRRVEQKGFRVAEATPENLTDLTDTRCLIECAALRVAIEQGDDAWEERLTIAHLRLTKAARSNEPNRFVVNPVWERHHRDFHIALIDAGAPKTLIGICTQLQDRVARFRMIANSISWPARQANLEHSDLYDAAMKRRADAAVALLEKHYRTTAMFVVEALKRKHEASV
jgi:DNA-binding GntR family transcriptional regulator